MTGKIYRGILISTVITMLACLIFTVGVQYQIYDEKIEELGQALTRYEEKIKELSQQIFTLQTENQNLNEKVNADFVNGNSDMVDVLKRIARLEKAVFNQ